MNRKSAHVFMCAFLLNLQLSYKDFTKTWQYLMFMNIFMTGGFLPN